MSPETFLSQLVEMGEKFSWKAEAFLPASDERVRGVTVRVMSKGSRSELVRRPVQHIYSLKIQSQPLKPDTVGAPRTTFNSEPDPLEESSHPRRCTCPTRKAALNAKDGIEGLLMDETDSIDWTCHVFITLVLNIRPTGGVYGLWVIDVFTQFVQ